MLLFSGIVLGMLGILLHFNTYLEKENAIETKTYTSKNEFVKSAADNNVLEDEPEISTKLKKGCVVVNVKTMCDKQYQKLHKDDWKV